MPPSVISPSTAVVLSVLYTVVYVVPFYLSSKTRPSPNLSRDSPKVIRARIRAVSLSCFLTCIATTYIARRNGQLSARDILHIYGWWPLDVLDIFRSLTLVALLFAGPLFESAIVEGQWRSWIKGGSVKETLESSTGWRNYVAGPFTEEFVFRSMLVAVGLLARETPGKLTFITPLYFGIAHIHHAYEFKLTHPRIPLLPTILRTVFQFTYTSLFGFYASFVLLRTGNLPAAVLTHTFCNWMGLPRLWGRVEAPGLIGPLGVRRQSNDSSNGVDKSPVVLTQDGQLHTGWTVSYYVILLAGVYAFYSNIWTLTASRHPLVSEWIN